MDGLLSRCERLFELVRGQGVSVGRPPNLESGLTLFLFTLYILGVYSRNCTFRRQLLPPLDHVAHALVQVGPVVVARRTRLHFRRDVIEALLQQRFEVVLLHPDHVPRLGARLEVSLDNGP